MTTCFPRATHPYEGAVGSQFAVPLQQQHSGVIAVHFNAVMPAGSLAQREKRKSFAVILHLHGHLRLIDGQFLYFYIDGLTVGTRIEFDIRLDSILNLQVNS